MNRREAMAALTAGGLATTATAADDPQNPDDAHIRFVAECARDIRKLSRTVTTRKELLEAFKPAGGRYDRTHQSFSYRRCPWFKVSVKFDVLDDDREGKPGDQITKISTPYLEDPFAE
jgi:hypothetical protein